jgi:amidase
VVPLAWSLDHVGIFSRTVEDCALALSLMAGADPADPLSQSAPVDDYAAAVADPSPPRLGVLRSLFERATPEMAAHLEATAGALGRAGAALADVKLPPSFAAIHDAGAAVMRAEAAAWHAPLYAEHAHEYPPKIREAIEAGRRIAAVDYLAAQNARRRFRAEMTPIAARYDALLLPVVPAPAPRGLGSTGDPYFCAPWSFAGLPAIALPSGLDGNGLPLSIQLVGGPFAEVRLLAAAAWCERVLAFRSAPRD